MKTLFSSAKRCLALVLALLLLIPAMAAPAFASTQTTVTVGDLMISNYASALTDAEKEFLSHGLLADTTVTFDVPDNDDGLITVDKDTKTITFKGFDDGNGNAWFTRAAQIVVNGVVVENVDLTFDGLKATGTYSYDGNAFSVVVPVSLFVQISEETQQDLLDAMADLRAGYDAIQGLYGEDGNVGLFEDALSQEGGLVDAANNGIQTGLAAPELAVAYLSDEATDAILYLDTQMTQNDGVLDLRKMLADYAAGYATDYLVNGDVDGLLAAANELIENLGIIHTEMTSQLDYLNGLIATLANSALWPLMGVDQAQYDALVACAENAETMTTAVSALKSHLETAAAHSGWNVDLTGVLAADVDYAHLDECVIALGEGYVSTVTPVSTLHAADTTLQHNMSMYNVTVELGLAVMLNNEEVLYDVNTVVLTLMENATREEIQAAIDASGIVAASKAEWAATGYYVPEHFGETTNGLPETLTEDFEYFLYYTPVRYHVDFDYQDDADLKYGSTFVLPVHEDITKAYDYKVNGVAYAQGSIITVDGDLTITRTEGRAYTNHSLFKMISEQFGNGEYELLSVRALTVKDQNVAVRYPTNGDNLVTISGTTVTAGTFNSDYYGLIWNPVSVDVYYEDAVVETVAMTNGTADITVDNFDYVSVNYELVLTNISAQQMVDVLNLAIDLKNEAAAQRECMAILADNLEYLQMLDKTMLGIIKGLADTYCEVETQEAVVFLQNNCMNPATNKLYLTEYLEFYTSDNGGLWYYYQNGNWAKIKAEVDKMLPYMQTIKDDPGIELAMNDFQGGAYADKYEAIPALVDALSSANFTGPNEVINLQSSFLQEFIDALDTWEPEQTTHYAPEDLEGYLTLTTSLTKTSGAKVQILVNVELKDKFGVSTTATYGPILYNTGITLDDAHKQEILAGVKALLESIDPYYSDIYTYEFGVEGSNLETELMNALSGALNEDLVLYYNWNEICYHENYITATCSTPNLCEVCGEYFGEVDPENHNWDEGVVTTPATCEDAGWTLYTCSWCNGEELREDIPATGHSWGEWQIVMLQDGSLDTQHIRYCENGCGSIELENHSWNEGVITTPAACETDGVLTYTCSVCGGEYTEAIPATGHSYTNYVSDGNATCTEDGTKTAACDNGCGKTDTVADPGSALGHSDADGDGDHNCDRCGEENVTDHNFGDATCEQAAACSECGLFTGEPIGHTDWNYDHICDRNCGETNIGTHADSADDNDHVCDYGCGEVLEACSDVVGDGDHDCDICGEADVSDHTYDDATCETPATCTECQATTGEPLEHSFTNYIYNEDADCINDGTKTAYCDHGCGLSDTLIAEGTALGHDFENGSWVDCCDDFHTKQCARCDEIDGVEYDHIYEGTNCEADDYCTACGHKKEAGQHSGAWTPIDGGHTRTCTVCGVVETADHEWADWAHDDDNTHSRVCSACGETETETHAWGVGVVTKEATITETGILTYTCSVCDHVKTQEIPVVPPTGGSSTSANSKREVIVSLNGDQGSIRYDLMYTITVDEYEVQVPVTNDMDYNFNLTAYFKEHYLAEFADEETMNSYLYSALRQGRISVTYSLIDTYNNQLYDFVKAMDEAANGALDFSLVNDNGNFSIVANVTNPAGAASNLMAIAQTFLFSGYSYISINTVDGFVPFFNDSKLSIQALIDGLLCEDGFGTNTIIELSKGNAASIPGDVVVDGGNIGGYLQKTQMQIGTDASAIQYTVDFYLTMNDMAELDQIANALNAVKNYITAETKNGELFVELTLPEKVYEVYLTLMLATGEVDKSDVNAIESAIAFRFLYDYVDLILNTEADTETFENTLAMLGQSYDLSSYENYYQILKELLTTGTTDAMGGDVVVNLDLNKDEAEGTLGLVANAKTLLDTLLAAAGMGGMEVELDLLIKEYHNNENLSVTAKAELSEAKPAFQVAVIDIRNGSTLDKADYATDGVARINNLAGEAAVVLLADITGDLVINDVTILDLNGYTITGNIIANGTLIIVDSSMDSDDCGGVDGSISGNVIIIAGNYTTDVSAYLADGYAQNGTAVTNALYTVDVDADGNITININSDVMNEVADGYIPAVRELAVDIAVDLVLNYITTAALAVDGEDLYAVDLTDIIGLVKGEDKVEKVIDELLSYIKVDTGITNFVNTIIDDLLDFEAIAEGLANDTPVATYTITTKPWMIHVGHNTEGDYIEFGISNNETLAKTFDLSLVISGDNAKTYLLPVIEELAEIVTKKDVNVQLYQPLYDNKTLHNVGGTFSADIALDMTGEYPVVIAVILAYSGVDMGEDLTAVLAAYKSDPSCAVLLKDEIDEVTVSQIIKALKGMSRTTDFKGMAKAAGIDMTKVDLDTAAQMEKAYHLILCGAGKVLEYLEIFGGSQTLGSLERASGVYAADKENIIRSGAYTHSSGYGIAYNVTVTEVVLSVKLFDTCEHVYTAAVTDPTCTEQGYTTYTCACGDSYVADYVPATGHAWGNVTYTWAEDNSTVTATHTCGNNAAHVESETVGTTSVTTDPTCEDEGKIVYTTNAFTNPAFSVQTKVVIIDATGHAWGNWTDNGDGKTHSRVCANDPGHVDTADHNFGGDYICDDCGYDKTPSNPPVNPPVIPTPGHCLWCDKDHCPSAAFSDLNLSQWYHTEGYTDYVLCRGLMIGMGNDKFAPSVDTTRAMIVLTLYRIEGCPEVTGESTYTDVRNDVWYSDAIIWATENGIVEGYGNGCFGPMDYVTREQIDTIFYRYAGYKGLDTSMSNDLSGFVDADKVSDWALDAVKWAVAVELMKGRSTTELVPRDATTRAETAALLYRWCEELN